MTNKIRSYIFKVATKQVSELYGAECDMSSPPAVGAESVVETSHDHLTNGNAFEAANDANPHMNNTAGLDLLQQAAVAIGDSLPPGAVELTNFMVEKDLGDHDLANYEDAVAADVSVPYNHGSGTNTMTNAASNDPELYNEDLMMAIMNSSAAANGQHRQSQPS